MNKVKIYKCYDFSHTMGTTPNYKSNANDYWTSFWNEKITFKGNYIYRCKVCTYINLKKKKFNERFLPDDFVLSKLTGMKDTDIDSIHKPLIELKRATLKFKYTIENPTLECSKHGKLYAYKKETIKSGKDKNGFQKYKCRQCMKELHSAHYKKNKVAILSSQQKYKDENPEKYKEIKNRSKRKMYALDKEKYAKRRDDYDKANPQKKAERQKRYKDKATKEITDAYAKQHLVRGTALKFKDIPPEMVRVKKGLMKINRMIKAMKEKPNNKIKG